MNMFCWLGMKQLETRPSWNSQQPGGLVVVKMPESAVNAIMFTITVQVFVVFGPALSTTVMLIQVIVMLVLVIVMLH